MAHGFRHVPKQRAASPDTPRCPFCHARYDVGTWPYNSPHICKEVTYGTALSSLPMLPLHEHQRLVRDPAPFLVALEAGMAGLRRDPSDGTP